MSLPPHDERKLKTLIADIENKAIDKSVWRYRNEPVINEFRARQPDMLIEMDCPECSGAGMTGTKRCMTCKGNKRIPDTRWPRGEASDIQYARLQVRNILNYLWEIDVLNDTHVWEARSYDICHGVYAAARGSRYSSNSIYGRGESGMDGKEERAFSLLLQRMSPKHHGLIQRSLPPATEHEKWVAYQDRHHFLTAFETLVFMIEKIRDELADQDE